MFVVHFPSPTRLFFYSTVGAVSGGGGGGGVNSTKPPAINDHDHFHAVDIFFSFTLFFFQLKN